MLPNNLAKAVADLPGTATPINRLRREFPQLLCTIRRLSEGPYFLNRADADPVGLTQGAVNGSGFGNAHFRPMDQCGNIRGISIAITDKTTTGFGLVNRSAEGITAGRRIR